MSKEMQEEKTYNISEIKDRLPENLFEVIKKRGVNELRAFQFEAIEKGLLDKKNIVVSAPTASGKTFLAEIASLKSIRCDNGKALYLVPLKALAQEFYENFKNWYGGLGIKIGIAIGDLDSPDTYLQTYDWIIATTEKIDSVMRHGAGWLKHVTTIVVDEFHLLGEPGRGATLEILLTKLRHTLPEAQIVGLSATIKNASELASWMDAELILSNFRPVPLYEGIYENGNIHLYWRGEKQGKFKSKGDDERPDLRIIQDTLLQKKQILVFVSSRRLAESMAVRVSKMSEKYLSAEEKTDAKKISEEVLDVLEKPTQQCKKLSEVIEQGVAFHHAGAVRAQLSMIEEAFKKGSIKVIACTPTLALGVNLPSHTCLIRDLKRFNEEDGMGWISVMEFKQYAGRAGRPKYDQEGRAIVIAEKEGEFDEIVERFIKADTEKINSQLFDESILRTHLLSLVADLFIRNYDQALDFFSRTFFFFQYGKTRGLEEKILQLFGLLEEWGFIEKKNNTYHATPLGKRVSELYLDPLDGWRVIDFLKESKNLVFKDELTYLQFIAGTGELSPPFRVSAKEKDELVQQIAIFENSLWQKEPSYWSNVYDKFLRVFKTALIFYLWMDEKNEDFLQEKHKVMPGELFARVQSCEWMLYAAQEIARKLKAEDAVEIFKKLKIRMHYGIKEELLDLVRLKEIGRVRARMLFNTGYKNVKSLREASEKDIAKIVGVKIAKKIKEQVDVQKTVQST